MYAQLKDVQGSISYPDYLEYRDRLHALKGSASELGATKLVEVCLQGEALKPYDLGSEKIDRMSSLIEKVFNETVTALSSAVTADQETYPERSKDN